MNLEKITNKGKNVVGGIYNVGKGIYDIGAAVASHPREALMIVAGLIGTGSLSGCNRYMVHNTSNVLVREVGARFIEDMVGPKEDASSGTERSSETLHWVKIDTEKQNSQRPTSYVMNIREWDDINGNGKPEYFEFGNEPVERNFNLSEKGVAINIDGVNGYNIVFYEVIDKNSNIVYRSNKGGDTLFFTKDDKDIPNGRYTIRAKIGEDIISDSVSISRNPESNK